ncbi:hypothetical protein HO133_006510 [Letharia lupina]|uniref:Uncharacterized protein n=1 Tax=Letharia lupina TaxID=560253 RepID=A0A8H6C6X9_9LECA|nr:uncharacterized protein HO133_006510 [Letharia lupina]KAF6218098.1 hypothetical protein HO133_006510 [Letharia lupina]
MTKASTMVGKPFRIPLLRKTEESGDNDGGSEPQAKKRRISSDKGDGFHASHFLAVKNPAVATESLDGGSEVYYNVLWRKYTTKKHKTWDGDGVLKVTGGHAHLQDTSGRDMGKASCDWPLLPGSQLSIGGKEVEVDSILSKEDSLAGRPFLKSSILKFTPEFVQVPLPNPKPRPDSKAALLQQSEETKKPLNLAAPRSVATQAMFKNPLLASTVMPKQEPNEPTPRHDPTAAQAIVMKRPKTVPKGKQVVDVVVDPLLAKHLREHQREGVKFMYECVMGMRDFDGQGAILADEMGLGKSLSTIALLWTLLKQNPICDGSHNPPPVIKKALIVCPVTLINNWRKEFRKWLGVDRLGVYVFDGSKKHITGFTTSKAYPVGIIGYEKLRTVVGDLKKGHGIDIVIADEGHRLKTAKNKSAQAIKSLNTSKRVILSGTPIQNDLSEFFMMVDFVNPDLLGSFKTFTKEFEFPIVKSRQPGALRKDVEKGEARSEELALLTSMFILRRTADILSRYLPSKTELLGSPEASLQLITVLKKVCNSPSLLNGKTLSDPSVAPDFWPVFPLIYFAPTLVVPNYGSLINLCTTFGLLPEKKIVLVSNYTATLDLLQTLLTSLSYHYLRLDGSTPSSKRQELVDAFNRSSASECFAFLLSAKSGGVGLNLIGASRLVLFDVDWNPATDLQAMARIHRDGQKRPCVIYRFVMAGGLDEKIWQRQTTKLGLANNIMDQKGGTSNFTKEELEDLFRLDEGLSCQTHDLLGCCCEGRGLPAPFPVDEELTEILDSDDEVREEEMPDLPRLIQANNLDMEEQERKIKEDARSSRNQKDGAKMDLLMAYSHVDTSNFSKEDDDDMEALVHDKVLLDVLKDEGNRVSFVFAKTSG